MSVKVNTYRHEWVCQTSNKIIYMETKNTEQLLAAGCYNIDILRAARALFDVAGMDSNIRLGDD